MERKTKRIYIRLTPDDEALFRRKAARYQTVSAMVRDAVKQFDDTATLGKIDVLHAMMDYYKRYEQQLSWLGSNFNQSVHRANELAISEELTCSSSSRCSTLRPKKSPVLSKNSNGNFLRLPSN